MRRLLQVGWLTCALAACSICNSQSISTSSPRIIELTADRDSRYRQGHKASPTIEVVAGEPLILRITAVRAKEVARDGSVHGLALLDQNSNVVAGWRFFLHPGVQDLAVTAPLDSGRYAAVCTVICSDGHDGMGFTLLVNDPKARVKESK
jgi:heme/copper-type cytochrome/quinol oxidase subunit 2